MFALLQKVSVRQLIIEQLPALLISIVIAEAFYKFRSFTLECMAFLVTWYVIDAVLSRVYTAAVRAGLIHDPSIAVMVKE